MLFDEVKIGEMSMRNRMIRSATAEMLADENGRPLPELAALYRDLASGEVGLIVTGHMYVHPTGKAHPGMMAIDRDELVPRLEDLTRAVHEGGGRIAAQINHAGRQTRAAGIAEALAPSSAPAVGPKRVAAREMSEAEIRWTIEAYARAAGRAKEAGFDGVQLHAAHGYLISQFLSPLANRRTDDWGGRLTGRMRFLEAVSRAVRAEVGSDYPLLVKLGLRDESDEGLSLAEGVEIVGRLADFGVDAVELSGGLAESSTYNIRTGVRVGDGEAYFRPWAAAAQAVARIPVSLVGGIRSQAVAEEILASGDAQFVSLCRALICEPDLPKRWREGRAAASACVSQNRCWPVAGRPGISCKCPSVSRGSG
jgi:2,4-dienoyl-CoA reductase-like NADH-dependent reductase (Old Yellow Enzyme family)